MRWLRAAIARLRASVRRDAIASEIKEELDFHLDMRVEQLIRLGLPSAAARRRALQRFGNPAVHQDEGYDIRGGGVMETVLQDLRYSLRLLRANRGFTITAVLTLAIGVGLSTTLFTVIHAALIRPLPYPEPDRLVEVSVTTRSARGRTTTTSASLLDVRAWRADGRVFSHIAVDRDTDDLVVDAGGEPERLSVRSVSENYFELFGIAPFAGRPIRVDDTDRSAPLVALLGHEYWQSHFGGDPDVVGRGIRINAQPATIVGILPPHFHPDVALWQPIRWSDGFARMRGTGADVIGRLRPALSREAAAGELSRLTDSRDQAEGRPAGTVVDLHSIYDQLVAGQGATVKTLGMAVGAILLIACVNVAGLLLARGATRHRELAVRASMGADRLRLARQLFTESVVLAAAGGITGVLLAWLSLDTLIAIVPLDIPETAIPSLNVEVLAFAGTVAILSAVMFGIVPAVRLSRATIQTALAGSDRAGGSSLPRRSGQSLIAIEVALAVVLLIGASLMVRSFARLVSVDLGFDPDSFLTMEVTPADPSAAAAAAFYPAFVDAIRRLPDVAAAGASNQLPIGGARRAGFVRLAPGADSIRVDQRWVLPGYFEAIGLRATQGRLPVDADRASAASVIVLNELAARQIFGPIPVVGRTFPMGFEDRNPVVIGVVQEMLQNGARSPARANVYWVYDGTEELSSATQLAVFIRPRAGARPLAGRLRNVAKSIGPPVVIDSIRTGADFVGDSVVVPRRRMQLLGLLGVVGLLLTLIGVFSVTAYAVARRTREIGIRMALGARAATVVRAFVGDTIWPVVLGLLVGLGLAYLSSRAIASLLYQTPPHDPVAYAVAALTLTVAAALAAWLPARRAARVDPVSALRME